MTFRSKLQHLAGEFTALLNSSGSLEHASDLDEYDWNNWLWTSTKYRRAHLQIVDKFESHKLFVLHCTIFPHLDNPAPIFGFDAICGPNKISGAFYDFSPAGDHNHPLIQWFAEDPSTLTWNKVRELPEWARAIFSPHMVAVSNIQSQNEVDQLSQAAILGLQKFLQDIDITANSSNNYTEAQNRYCLFQKKNPQVIRSMVNMGVSENKMKKFVEEILFPEVNLLVL